MYGPMPVKQTAKDGRNRNIRHALMLLVAVCVLVLSCASVSVKAAPQLLVDEADNLTPDQERTLTDRLIEVGDRYDADVVLLILDSLNGADAQSYADDFYDYNGYAENGVLFLLSVGDSKYAFSTLGTVAEGLTDAALDMIEARVVDALVRGKEDRDYYDAYVAYIEGVDRYMGMAAEGHPFEYEAADDGEPMHGVAALKNHLGGNVMLSAITGVAGSLAYMGGQKRKLKSVHRQRSAASYVTGNGLVLTASDDRFINRTVNRTPIPKQKSSSDSRSSGGTTYHTSSSGRSHGGRSGSF